MLVMQPVRRYCRHLQVCHIGLTSVRDVARHATGATILPVETSSPPHEIRWIAVATHKIAIYGPGRQGVSPHHSLFGSTSLFIPSDDSRASRFQLSFLERFSIERFRGDEDSSFARQGVEIVGPLGAARVQ